MGEVTPIQLISVGSYVQDRPDPVGPQSKVCLGAVSLELLAPQHRTYRYSPNVARSSRLVNESKILNQHQ